MTIFHSIVLGLIQGLGEFLPISSSAHLILFPWFFHFPDPGLSFDVALHTGTLVAVIVYFWRDWIVIFKLAFKNFQFSTLPTGRQVFNFQTISNDKISNSRNTQYSILNTQYNQNILYFLILATIPGVLVGYFLENYAESAFRSPILIAFTLSTVGLILYLVDKYHVHRKNLQKMTWLDSLLVGLSQAVAIIPGVSRSGATITIGLAMGLDRESAARFSFLLSTPIIFGAAVLKLPHLFQVGLDTVLILGMLSAALSGYFAIKYLLKFVRKTGYAIFFWYRLALAGVILIVYILR